jgi:hypothetical protein
MVRPGMCLCVKEHYDGEAWHVFVCVCVGWGGGGDAIVEV